MYIFICDRVNKKKRNTVLVYCLFCKDMLKQYGQTPHDLSFLLLLWNCTNQTVRISRACLIVQCSLLRLDV